MTTQLQRKVEEETRRKAEEEKAVAEEEARRKAEEEKAVAEEEARRQAEEEKAVAEEEAKRKAEEEKAVAKEEARRQAEEEKAAAEEEARRQAEEEKVVAEELGKRNEVNCVSSFHDSNSPNINVVTDPSINRIIYSPAPELIGEESAQITEVVEEVQVSSLNAHYAEIASVESQICSKGSFDSSQSEEVTSQHESELVSCISPKELSHFAEELCNIFLRFAVTVSSNKTEHESLVKSASARPSATLQRSIDELITKSLINHIRFDLAHALSTSSHNPVERLSVSKIKEIIKQNLQINMKECFANLTIEDDLPSNCTLPRYWLETVELISTRLAQDLMRSASHVMLVTLDDTIMQNCKLCSEWDTLASSYDSVSFTELFESCLNHNRLYGVLRYYLELTQRQCALEEKKNIQSVGKNSIANKISTNSSLFTSSEQKTSSATSPSSSSLTLESSASPETLTNPLTPLSSSVTITESSIALPHIITSSSALASIASLKQNLFITNTCRVQGAPLPSTTLTPNNDAPLTSSLKNTFSQLGSNGITSLQWTDNVNNHMLHRSIKNNPSSDKVKKLTMLTPLSNDAKRAGITQVVLENCIDSLLEKLLTDSTQ